MNEQIKIFENPRFGKIRTSGTSDEPLFCLADVCRVLELRTDAVKTRLKNAPISIGVIDSMGREQTAMFINEQNLYRVIMRSDKPQAEAFQDWVCGEVLPSIRKHGGYIASTPDDTPEVIMARALKIADETIKRREHELAAARQQLSVAEHTVEVQDRKLAEQRPKVEFYDAVTESEGSESFEDVAQTLKSKVLRVPNFGQKKLTEILREMKIIFGKGNNLRAYQEYLNRGYFEAINYPFKDKNGRPHIGHKTLITQRGKQFVVTVVKQYYAEKQKQSQAQQLFLFNV